MNHKILVTLGPSSLDGELIRQMNREKVYLYRINMSHTRWEDLRGVITEIQKHTDVPICLDSEGAQVRNHKMNNGSSQLITGTSIKIDYSEISKTEFDKKIELSKQKIKELNDDSKKLDAEINKNLEKINYDI